MELTKKDKKHIRFNFIELSRESFPEVKWEDKDPTKVKLVIDK